MEQINLIIYTILGMLPFIYMILKFKYRSGANIDYKMSLMNVERYNNLSIDNNDNAIYYHKCFWQSMMIHELEFHNGKDDFKDMNKIRNLINTIDKNKYYRRNDIFVKIFKYIVYFHKRKKDNIFDYYFFNELNYKNESL